jgi:hypothetical protein
VDRQGKDRQGGMNGREGEGDKCRLTKVVCDKSCPPWAVATVQSLNTVCDRVIHMTKVTT